MTLIDHDRSCEVREDACEDCVVSCAMDGKDSCSECIADVCYDTCAAQHTKEGLDGYIAGGCASRRQLLKLKEPRRQLRQLEEDRCSKDTCCREKERCDPICGDWEEACEDSWSTDIEECKPYDKCEPEECDSSGSGSGSVFSDVTKCKEALLLCRTCMPKSCSSCLECKVEDHFGFSLDGRQSTDGTCWGAGFRDTSDGTASTFKCPYGTFARPDHDEHKCRNGDCSPRECCQARCGSFKGTCPAGTLPVRDDEPCWGENGECIEEPCCLVKT